MNILELCLSSGFGGLELYALKSVKELTKSNNNIKAIVRKNTFLDEKLEELGVSRDYLHPLITNLPLNTARRLAGYLTTNKIDVIHIHWGHDLFLATLAKVLCRKSVKLVYTRQMALTRYKRDFYHRFLYKNVDAYVVITKSLYDEAKKYLPLKNDSLHLLYYGVPEPEGDNVDCKIYLADCNIEPSAFKLAIFGRIEFGKGQHLVIDAVRNLINEGKNIHVAMIGHIMDREYFETLQIKIDSYNLREAVHYLGFHNKPVCIMPCFDAVVLASKCETFGLVLPEAMRAGVAVIGSNCGGVPEIIKHGVTGLLFESENIEDLTNQLRKLIDEKELCHKLAKAGKADADVRFSEERHFQKLIDIFQKA